MSIDDAYIVLAIIIGMLAVTAAAALVFTGG